MDAKDKAIIWTLFLIIAYVIPLNVYGLTIGAVLVGILIKTIDAHFTQIIFWIRDHFDTDSRQ